MSRDEIIAGLRELLQRQKQLRVDVSAVTLDTRLDAVGFDSLSILDFVYDVEDRFGVETPMGELVRMERVSDLVGYLEGRLAG